MRKLSPAAVEAKERRMDRIHEREQLRRLFHYQPYAPREGRALEFMVVLVIIFIFVGFFYLKVYVPCFDTARKAACVNNLYRLGMALSAYTTDWDGRLPAPTEGKLDLRQALGNYVDRRNSLSSKKKKTDDLDQNYPFACPVRPKELGYGFNPFLAGQNPDQSSSTDMVLLGDICHGGSSRWWINAPRFLQLKAGNSRPDPCHQGKANFLFLDGHVVSRKPAELNRNNWIDPGE